MNVFVLLAFLLSVFAVDSNLMLPLDTCTSGDSLNNSYNFAARFPVLKQNGFSGVMVDVWWGYTEPNAGQYHFGCYKALADLCKAHNLELHAVYSFHACGGNVGDKVSIPIPEWARSAARSVGGFYVDHDGYADEEVLALTADEVSFLPSGTGSRRTPIQAYADWSSAFAKAMGTHMGTTVTGIEVGMGPAGELRYPSYHVNTYPRIGEFQCYSPAAKADFQAKAKAAGHSEWDSPPNDVCDRGYDCLPEQSSFFQNGIWSDYGKFMVKWYADALIGHGERILGAVQKTLTNYHVHYSVKIAGIHWQYAQAAHAPEVTAGYPNCTGCDGYSKIAQFCAKYGAAFDITCLEKDDYTENSNDRAKPGSLARQIAEDCAKHGATFAGENALEAYDRGNLGRVVEKYRYAQQKGAKLGSYTHLRWTEAIFSNIGNFQWLNQQLAAL